MAQVKDLIVEGSAKVLGKSYASEFIGQLKGNADTATALTTSAGSTTQPIYFYDGKPVACTYTLGKSVPSNAVFTDTKVTISANAPTSQTNYYPLMHTSTSGTTAVTVNENTRFNTITGTASTEGVNALYLGKNIAKGTVGNSTGKILLYSPSTSYHWITPASTSSVITHTLPATTGTILNSGTTSFTASLTSGTKIGTLKINGTSTDLYAPSNTDKLSLSGGTITGTIVGSGGGQFAIDGNVYLKTDGLTGWVSTYINSLTTTVNGLKTKLISNRLSVTWENDCQLCMYVDGINVAKIPSGFGNTLNYLPLTGGTLSGDIIRKNSGTNESKLIVANGSHWGYMVASGSGSFGLYSTTCNKWVIKCDTAGNIYLGGYSLNAIADSILSLGGKVK